jgi:integrase
LGLFTAIRPAELARITWRDIDLNSSTVTIPSKAAKLRSRRVIEMVGIVRDGIKLPPNLIEWLAPHATRKTPIRDANWRKDFDVVKEAAGLIKLVEVKDKERKQVVNYRVGAGRSAAYRHLSPLHVAQE